MRTVTITVQGRVQGVGFRCALREEAESRALRGWVRNRRDGSVEAEISGDDEAVDALLEWTRRGPSSARVDRLEVTDTDAIDTEGFDIRPTV
ncbi:MAG: acylphosphatase [Microbacterium sp.]|jgi:acylphosphatase|nr:acylphosphatase [Microbacterium sp.]